MSNAPTIVYVVGDDPESRNGLETLFREAGFHLQSFKAGQAFLEAYPKLNPGCLFVSLDTSGMGSLELMDRLRAAGCIWPTVIVTEHGTAPAAVDAMRAGAFAFLEKPLRELEVLATVSRAQAYLSHEAQLRYDEEIAKRIQRLSPREHQVYDHVLEGLLNKQIAAELRIGESTVKSTRRALMQRMQANSYVELIVMAIRGGMTIKSRS